MSELEQLQSILGPETRFWDDDAPLSFRLSILDGMLVKVIEVSGMCRWKVTHPDRTGYESTGLFRSSRQAKVALRLALQERLISLS
jgi:hypothetical protein